MGFVVKFVKWTLAIALAAVFIAAGANKLTGKIHPETHAFMVKGFNNYNKVTPFTYFEWSAEASRVLIGAAEVFFGALLLCPYYTRLSAFMLGAIMVGGTWVHYTMQETLVMPGAFLAACALLFLVSGDSVASKGKSAAAQNKKKQ